MRVPLIIRRPQSEPEPQAPALARRLFLSTDLGHSTDPTAVTVVEQLKPTLPLDAPARYNVTAIKRYRLGTSYPRIVEDVSAIYRRPEFGSRTPQLIADATGVGLPVVELFAAAGLNPLAITITSGLSSREDDGANFSAHPFSHWYVPKRELASVGQALLQSERLKCAPLPEAVTLLQELASFRVKITGAGNETFAAREGDHDDVLLAVLMACWVGEHLAPRYVRVL